MVQSRGLLAIGILLLLVTGWIGTAVYAEMTDEVVYEYDYTVKMEQVEQSQDVEEVVSFEELTGEEQYALHQAYRKTDHFLGGAAVVVTTDEPLDSVSTEWRVVSIEGVPILMSIQGPEKVESLDGNGDVAVMLGVWGIFIIGWTSIFFIRVGW